MPHTSMPAQTAYLETHALYEEALETHSATLSILDFDRLFATGATTKALLMVELQAQAVSHLDEATDTLLSAEKELLAWGQGVAMQITRRKGQGDETAYVNDMYARIHRYPHLKKRLVEICLQLDVNA